MDADASGAELFDFHALARRNTRWTDKAACAAEIKRTGIDYWYTPDTEGTSHNNAERSVIDLLYTDAQRISIGKRICGTCPARLDCLADALDRDEREGVWGGMTTEERDLYRSLTIRKSA